MRFKNRIKKALSANSRDESLLTRGRSGTAEVLSVKRGWVKTETNSGSESIYKYRLRVTVDGQAPYETPHSENERAEAGTTVAVKVDPDDPENLLIDWGVMAQQQREAVQARVASVESMFDPTTLDAGDASLEPIDGISLERYAELSASRVKHGIATADQMEKWLEAEGVSADSYQAATAGWSQRMAQQPAVAMRYATLYQQSSATPGR